MFGKKDARALKPRKNIELSGKNIALRVVLMVLFIGIALAGVYFGVKGLLTRESGWTRIEADSSSPAQASADLDFEYCLSSNATMEYKLLTKLYTETSLRAWQVYHPTEAFTGLGNLQSVNAAPNQECTVEPELYRAFELLQAKGSRVLFLAPVCAQYDAVFRSLSDDEAAAYDPAYSEEAAAYVAEVMGFVSDPQAISLDLLGENRVRLKVREDYLRYAAENGIDAFLDFYWLKNAFVLDDIAAKLGEQGFRRGYLASREGFCRYLDSAEDEYTLRIQALEADGIRLPASLQIRGPMSLACLHSYSGPDLQAGDQSDRLIDYFYTYRNGRMVTPYLNPVTGESRAVIWDLTLLSPTASCGELALSALPALTAETWDAAAVAALPETEIAAIWCEGNTLYHTELPAELTMSDGTYTEQTVR